MVHTCCVFKCSNRAVKGSKLSFHRFPSKDKEKERYEAWLRVVNRQTEAGCLWEPSGLHDKVCSEHFAESCYKSHTENRMLKDDAVPSIFPHHPLHLQKPVSSPRPPPKKRKLEKPHENTPDGDLGLYIRQDHSYCYRSPEDHIRLLQEKINSLENALMESRAANKLLKEKLKRRDTKCDNLIQELEDQKLISAEAADLLHLNFNDNTLSLINNELQATKTTPKNHRYSEAAKEFAVTVHFYSPKAYDYLRGFLHLPHPSVIRRWAASVVCEPGFLSDVLSKLGQELSKNTDMRDVCVMFDAMSIKKECVYDVKTGCFAGGVNFGQYMDSKSEMATEALFFMVVGIKGRWKMPFGYFLGKAGGEMQAQLVKHAVCLLSEKGFNVVGVTCDGSYANQKTATLLGCSLDINSLKPSFPHPEIQNQEIFFLFDACHLIKNVRNCIGDLKVINYRGQEIKWKFIEDLHNVQLADDIHLANKITHKHVNFAKSKMNVRLAAQPLSNSVADAIDFLRQDEGHPNFEGSEATTTFIRNIDSFFDMCNSKNPVAKGSKSKIDKFNLQEKSNRFEELCGYLRELTDVSGKLLVNGRRKTPFVGFIITAMSVCGICKNLIERVHEPFAYVLTIRFSQDHLEKFFSRLRRKGGWNNNPNALQLKWSLRALLLHNGVTASPHANCVDVDDNSSIISQSPILSKDAVKLTAGYIEVITKPSDYHNKALFYIAGYVCRRICSVISCTPCATQLFTLAAEIPDLNGNSESSFVRRKNRGGLIASNDFFRIIAAADKELKRLILTHSNPIAAVDKQMIQKVQAAVCETVRGKVFLALSTHFLESAYLPDGEDHGVQMIKAAVSLFVRMLMKHHAKILNNRFVQDQPSVRHHLTKTIIFLHQ